MANPLERKQRQARKPSRPVPRDLRTETADQPNPDDTQPVPGQKRTRRQVLEFLEQARERFKQAQDAEKQQRERELADLKFAAGDQWPEDIRIARAGENALNGMPPVPARPCLTIDKTREPIKQVLNQERLADIGIEIVPADDFGDLGATLDDTEITLREGLVRRIQRESEAHDARTWAFNRAVKAGRGFYVVGTRYVNERSRDQEVYVRRIYNQAAVTLDPAHEQPDGSDAKWGFIDTYLSRDAYRAAFPTRFNTDEPNPLIDQSDEEFQALGDHYPDWFKYDGKERSYRVAEYYYMVQTQDTLLMLADGTDVLKSAFDGPVPEGAQTRVVTVERVKWATIDGSQILDETDWLGRYIPIIKVLGEELQPYDTDRRVQGMVRPMRDPGMAFNFMVTKEAEVLGLTPIPPLMMAEGQAEGYESWYLAANTRTLPYLYYKQTDLEGKPAGPPTTPARDLGAIIQPLAMAIQLFDQSIQSVSAIHTPMLGQPDPAVTSGKQAQAYQQQGQLATSDYLDNLARSIRYEGRIINDLLYPIYGRPGRIARILNGEGEAQSVLLHQPFTVQNGWPTAVPHGTPNAQHYTLTKDARFDVVVKVSKSFDSRREQEASIVGGMLSANPGLLNVFGDLYFKNLDGPGHQEMADRVKTILAPPIQQMLAAKAQGQAPPDPHTQMLAAQNQQLQQQLAQAQQAIQSKTAEAQAKAQGDLQIAQVQSQADFAREVKLQEMKNATLIAVARINAGKAVYQANVEAQEEQLADGLKLAHEQREAAKDRAHDVGMAALDHVHQTLQAAQAHSQQLQQTQASAQAQSQVQADAAQQQASSSGQTPPSSNGNGAAGAAGASALMPDAGGM